MTPAAIIAIVAQILALAPTLLQAASAVKQLGEMVENGNTSDADIQALLDGLSANSGTISEIAAADAAPAAEDPPTG